MGYEDGDKMDNGYLCHLTFTLFKFTFKTLPIFENGVLHHSVAMHFLSFKNLIRVYLHIPFKYF